MMGSGNSGYAGNSVECEAEVFGPVFGGEICVIAVKGKFPDDTTSTELSDVVEKSKGRPFNMKLHDPTGLRGGYSRVLIEWVPLENGSWGKDWHRLD